MVIFFLALLMSIGNIAYANDSSVSVLSLPSTISGLDPENDVSVNILKTLFAGLPIFGGGTDAVQNVFRILNVMVLFMGGILASYNLMLGMLKTAEKGQMLGDYNTQMTPLRTVFAVGMILPIANGYSLIQVAIMSLVLQGIGVASAVWATFVSGDTLAESLAMSPIQPEVKGLTRNVLLASMCMASFQSKADKDGYDVIMGWSYGYGKDRKLLQPNDLVRFVEENPEKGLTLHAGNVKNTEISDNACGTIYIAPFETTGKRDVAAQNGSKVAGEAANMAVTGIILTSENANTTTKIGSAVTGLYSGWRILFDTTAARKEWAIWLKEMTKEHANSTERLLFDGRKIADNIIANIDNNVALSNQDFVNQIQNSPNANMDLINQLNTKTKEAMSEDEIVKLIDGLSSTYQTQLRAKALKNGKTQEVYDALVKNANEAGWMLSGTFFTQMGSLTDSVNKITTNLPTSTFNINNPNNLMLADYHSKYLSKLNYYFSKTQTFEGSNFRVNNIDEAKRQDEAGKIRKFVDSGLDFSILIDDALKTIMTWSLEDQEHVMIQLKRLGGLMLNGGAVLLTYLATNLGENSSNVGFFISFIGWSLVATLFTGGVTMNYVLPMLPTFIWFGMVLGWLVLVIQAMIASPFWIMMHLSPHKGDDFIGGQRQGYMLTLSIIARPTLMTLGFICAVIMLNVIGYFINLIFIYAFSLTDIGTNSLITSLISLIVVPLMYSAFMYTILKEVLSLMHKIPDEILSWLGGGQQLGSYAQQMSGGSLQAFAVLNQQIGSPVGGMRRELGELHSARKQSIGNMNDMNERQKLEDEKFEGIMSGQDMMVGSNGEMNSNMDGYYGGQDYASGVDDNNTLEKEDYKGWADMSKNGVVMRNKADMKSAKKSMVSAPQHYRKRAIMDAIRDTKANYDEIKAHNDNNNLETKPLSNQVLADNYNRSMVYQAFGQDKGSQYMDLMKMAENRAGKEEANKMLRNTFKKIDILAEQNGGDYDKAAREVGENIIGSMNSFINSPNVNTGTEPRDLSYYANESGVADRKSEYYKHAGSMLNAINSYTRGTKEVRENGIVVEQGMKADDKALQTMKYNRDKQKFEFGSLSNPNHHANDSGSATLKPIKPKVVNTPPPTQDVNNHEGEQPVQNINLIHQTPYDDEPFDYDSMFERDNNNN